MPMIDFNTECFVAIDFETADYQADSACAIGVVRVEKSKVVERVYKLIKPPRKQFVFTYIHGITWDDVREEPVFRDVWNSLLPVLDGADFIAAHNASFDRGVLYRCCQASRLFPPPLHFLCTVQLARKVWGIRPTNLPSVCKHLKIPLDHHNAISDAEACARIVIAGGGVEGNSD